MSTEIATMTPRTLDWLLSAEAAQSRARRAPIWVVHIETPEGVLERDAEELEQAMDGAEVWALSCPGMRGYAATIRAVMPDGRLGAPVRRVEPFATA